MKCRKDFVAYLKYCQREIAAPVHNPMYVRAEIKGDVLNLISYSFKQLPSNRDLVFDKYERMILDCKYYPYWENGQKVKSTYKR